MTAQAIRQDAVRQAGHRRDLIQPLRTAMAPGVILDRLRQEWPYARRRGFEIVAIDDMRVFPRGAKGFVLEYQLRVREDGHTRAILLTGELIGRGADSWRASVVRKLGKSKRGQLASKEATDLLFCLDDLGLVLRCAALDEQILGFKLLHDQAFAASVFGRHALPEGAAPQRPSIALLGHRLGKRAIARIRFDASGDDAAGFEQRTVVAKLYKTRSDHCKRVFAVMENLWADGFGDESDIRIPQPIAYLPEWQTILMEDVGGVLLPDLLSDAAAEGTGMAGRAIAKLHRTSLAVAEHHDVDDEIALLADWVALAGDVYAGLRSRFEDAFATVRDGLQQCRGAETALVHRDFYEKQILVCGDTACLIDFDTLCMADPAIDLGNFIAHQALAELQGRGGAVKPMSAAFLEGYRSASSLPPRERIDAYTLATLLRVACIHVLWLRWTQVVNPLLGLFDSVSGGNSGIAGAALIKN